MRDCNRKIFALLTATALLTALGGMKVREAQADAQTRVHRQTTSSPLVIQGRITAMEGALVTVKTPDGYPGRGGIHAQVVIAGLTFKVDISGARVLLPDGKQEDKQPLAVGDYVLMVLSGENSQSLAAGSSQNMVQTYSACIIERIAPSDTIITH